jgi:hypothetical protein
MVRSSGRCRMRRVGRAPRRRSGTGPGTPWCLMMRPGNLTGSVRFGHHPYRGVREIRLKPRVNRQRARIAARSGRSPDAAVPPVIHRVSRLLYARDALRKRRRGWSRDGWQPAQPTANEPTWKTLTRRDERNWPTRRSAQATETVSPFRPYAGRMGPSQHDDSEKGSHRSRRSSKVA